jgi:hypothetical protein
VLDERKERVLHTRVPQSLDRQLKRRARNLGLSVSTVVRHVLLNTFGLVEDIVTDSTNVALSMAGEESELPLRPRRAREQQREFDAHADADVVAWQEAVLNLNAVCDACNTVLPKGARAAIGLREGTGPRAIICNDCLGSIGAGDEHGEPRDETEPRASHTRGRKKSARPRARK